MELPSGVGWWGDEGGGVSDTFFLEICLFFLEILRTFIGIFLCVLRSEYSFSDGGTFLS